MYVNQGCAHRLIAKYSWLRDFFLFGLLNDKAPLFCIATFKNVRV